MSYLAQFVKYLVSLIANAQIAIIESINSSTKSTVEVVATESGKVVQAIEHTAEAQNKLSEERQDALTEQYSFIKERLSEMNTPETEEEIRRAIESFLPEDLKLNFVW